VGCIFFYFTDVGLLDLTSMKERLDERMTKTSFIRKRWFFFHW
jgi:hypothetical protein